MILITIHMIIIKSTYFILDNPNRSSTIYNKIRHLKIKSPKQKLLQLFTRVIIKLNKSVEPTDLFRIKEAKS